MLNVLQSLRTGVTELADVPVPRASPTTIVVETRASVVSPGTERMLLEFGRAGWIEKARSQPDKVSQVLNKMMTDGVASTTLGEIFVVYGLGPIGLLTVQIARAAGCVVIAIDRDEIRCGLAERFGAKTIVADDGHDLAASVLELTGGVGADAVLLTLS